MLVHYYGRVSTLLPLFYDISYIISRTICIELSCRVMYITYIEDLLTQAYVIQAYNGRGDVIYVRACAVKLTMCPCVCVIFVRGVALISRYANHYTYACAASSEHVQFTSTYHMRVCVLRASCSSSTHKSSFDAYIYIYSM